MSGPASTPEAGAPRRTAHGTIVGMPPVVRAAPRLGELGSTTMKSVYAPEDIGPCSDAFHPERWSNPPPLGADPIVPCDEPEEDEDLVYVHREAAPSSPVGERTTPSASAVEPPPTPAPPEPAPVSVESEALTVRRPPLPEPKSAEPADDELVILPFRAREADPERKVLLVAALVSAGAVIVAVCGAIFW